MFEELGVEGTIALIIFIAMVFTFYMFPWVISLMRDHPHRLGIFFLNLLLGWSLVGWVAALVWAFVKPQEPRVVVGQRTSSTADELAKLHELHTAGVLTAEEYDAQKRKVLSS